MTTLPRPPTRREFSGREFSDESRGAYLYRVLRRGHGIDDEHCAARRPDDQELVGVVEITSAFEHDDQHDDPADDRAAAEGGPAMTRDDREFRQLGQDHWAAGLPRHRFQDPHLQRWYDAGYDVEEEMRRAELAAGFDDPQDDGGP